LLIAEPLQLLSTVVIGGRPNLASEHAIVGCRVERH
jgi:hypothetical protein